MTKFFNQFFSLETKIHEFFGYQEDWKKIPLKDFRLMHWWYDNGRETIWFSSRPFDIDLINEGAELYSMKLYKQRFLSRWVYETEDYTMICVDPQLDDNKYLGVFSNTLKLTEVSSEMMTAFRQWVF